MRVGSERLLVAVLFLVLIMAIGVAIWQGLGLTKSDGKNVPEDDREVLKLGVVLPLSGSTARYGTWIRNALELARAQHNSTLSNRYVIRYIVEDDHGDARGAVSAAQKLIRVDRVPAIFGTWSSTGVLAMAPVVEEAKIVLMADAISPQIRDAGEWIFRCVPDARLSLDVLANHLTRQRGVALALLFINNDFGRDLSSHLQRKLQSGGAKVALFEAYSPTTQDFRSLLERVRASGANALFVAGYAEQGNLLRQAREAGLSLPVYAAPSFENPDILDQAGAAAEGVIYPNYFDRHSATPAMSAFLTQYRRQYGEEAEGFGASAYAGMRILAAASESCARPTPTCIRQTLKAIDSLTTVFGPTSLDEVGDIRYPLFLKQVSNGEFVRYKPSYDSN